MHHDDVVDCDEGETSRGLLLTCQELDASYNECLVKVMRLETELQVSQKSQETLELYRTKVLQPIVDWFLGDEYHLNRFTLSCSDLRAGIRCVWCSD